VAAELDGLVQQEGKQSPRFLMKCQTSEEWKHHGASRLGGSTTNQEVGGSKTIVSALQNLTEEASFDVDATGVKFRAMDPSHVALIDLVWEAGGFEKFEFQGKERDRFAVRVEDFAKIIKRADKSDSIAISRNGSSSDALLIKLGDHRDFEFHLLEMASVSSTPLPNLSFVSKFSMNSAVFETVLDDISALSSHMRIKSEPDGTLEFSGKGDAGNARVIFSQGELPKFDSLQESDAVYSIEYVQKVLKPASSGAEVIEFSFASKMPLTASVNVGDPSRSKLKLAFFLAPRTSE
jgi:proliferating cell nuclear antigen